MERTGLQPLLQGRQAKCGGQPHTNEAGVPYKMEQLVLAWPTLLTPHQLSREKNVLCVVGCVAMVDLSWPAGAENADFGVGKPPHMLEMSQYPPYGQLRCLLLL